MFEQHIAYPYLNRTASSVLKNVIYLIPPEPELAVQKTRAHECCYRAAEFRENGSCDRCLVNVSVVDRERHSPTHFRTLTSKTLEKLYQGYELIVVPDQISQ